VLAYVGAGGATMLRTVALNDYAVNVPVTDALDYDVILAMSMNGETLRVRDRGPLWIIYPWTEEYPELRNEIYHGRSIWQLKGIIVK